LFYKESDGDNNLKMRDNNDNNIASVSVSGVGGSASVSCDMSGKNNTKEAAAGTSLLRSLLISTFHALLCLLQTLLLINMCNKNVNIKNTIYLLIKYKKYA
jgi:hypothetical protein